MVMQWAFDIHALETSLLSVIVLAHTFGLTVLCRVRSNKWLGGNIGVIKAAKRNNFFISRWLMRDLLSSLCSSGYRRKMPVLYRGHMLSVVSDIDVILVLRRARHAECKVVTGSRSFQSLQTYWDQVASALSISRSFMSSFTLRVGSQYSFFSSQTGVGTTALHHRLNKPINNLSWKQAVVAVCAFPSGPADPSCDQFDFDEHHASNQNRARNLHGAVADSLLPWPFVNQRVPLFYWNWWSLI